MSMEEILQPQDEHNQHLAQNVHPATWANPKPDGRYNLVVVGGGTAGLVAAAGAAGLGAKVALIERSLLGGDCLNTGCVPSKAIIASGRRASLMRKGASLGVSAEEIAIDFPNVMQRMRKLRSEISHHDSAMRFQGLGVDVFIGQGTFESGSSIKVTDRQGEQQVLSFKKAVIATGARAAPVPIEGLASVPFLTNESLFSLTQLPKQLLVLGGGPIGSEMAQTFANFGSKVTLVERSEHILSREDPQAAKIVQASLIADGVEVLTDSQIVRIENRPDGNIATIRTKNREKETSFSHLLVAIGRAANVEGLGLENAGVQFYQHGVEVDDYLRTTNKNIFAAGDICSNFKFTHAADFMARTVIGNALFFGRGRVSRLVIPWATYTHPELAQVGLTEKEAREKNAPYKTFTQSMDGVDRAILEGDTEGFVKILTKGKTDQILGATIVGSNAGDLISTVSLAMKNGIGLKQFASTIFPYPTQAEAIRKLGDQFNRTRLTPTVKSMFDKWLRWTR